MAQQTINVGTTANDGTGDALRIAGGKINDNFTELYTGKLDGSAVDTDSTMAADSDSKVPSQKAVKTALAAKADSSAVTSALSAKADTSSLASVATSGSYSDLTSAPTLGTAAAADVGTSAGNVVQLDGTGKLPAVDGSALTNLPSAGGGLAAANNLSDVADANTSADNIGAYRKGTILGTVSQSGGVPTGAIIEYGSNANGEYIKYADGTMICWADISSGSLAISTAFLGGFRSDGQTWTFPAEFSDTPKVSISPTSLTAFGVAPASRITTSATFVYTAVTSQGSSARSATAIAIGRWF